MLTSDMHHPSHTYQPYSGLFSSHSKDSSALHERLHIPKSLQEAWNNDQCEVCTTHVDQLKQEAVAMVQSLEEAQANKDGSSINKLSSLMGSRDLASLQRYLYAQHSQNGSPSHHRSSRQGKSGYPAPTAGNRLPPPPQIPIAIQAQQYLEKTLGSTWWAHPKLNMALSQYQVSLNCFVLDCILWFSKVSYCNWFFLCFWFVCLFLFICYIFYIYASLYNVHRSRLQGSVYNCAIRHDEVHTQFTGCEGTSYVIESQGWGLGGDYSSISYTGIWRPNGLFFMRNP